MQLDDQQRCFVALIPERPRHGEAACSEGSGGVVGLRLKGKGPGGERLEAHPPLLRRVSGRSRWGDFAYQPVVARQGRRVTREHQLPLALMALLLEKYQQGSVSDMLVIGGTDRLERHRVGFSSGLRKQLAASLRKLTADLERKDPPALALDRRKCCLCSWRMVCNEVAKEEGHLSEVSGIGAKRLEILQQLGINGLNDLAEADPLQLAARIEPFGEQHVEVVWGLVAQARCQRDGHCERLQCSEALPELSNAPGVLVYDIESDPDCRHDFLHGFLCLHRKLDDSWSLQTATYHPILVLPEHNEQHSWARLNRFLARYKDWPILHYGETESISLSRMARRQGVSEKQIVNLRNRFVDVHARLRSTWRLPLNSYGLKAVASWRGFRWGKSGVDGARALLWWRKWRGSGPKSRGNRHSLSWIFEYNRDDCLATWEVANWLLDQDDEIVFRASEKGGG